MTDITIRQGSLFEMSVGMRDPVSKEMIPLTAANGGPRDLQARLQIRRRAGALADEDLFLDLSSQQSPDADGSGLWLDQTPAGDLKLGFVWVRVAPVAAARLSRAGEWDVEVFDPADPVFVVALDDGKVFVKKRVTVP